MTLHRSAQPSAWSAAAVAAFVAGLAATGAAAAPVEPIGKAAVKLCFPIAVSRMTDVIALRPDPANPHRLVVDFGPTASGGAFDAGT